MTAQHHAEYQEILEFAYTLAEKATELILRRSAERWSQSTELADKKNSVDLVTATDREVEEMIKGAISQRYPTHKFIGEETEEALEGSSVLTDDFTWIVDPIDGTMNFVHSNPNVGCSIGVTHLSTPVVGVLAQPFMNGRILSARLGGGAFLNKTIPLPLTGGIPQPLESLKQSLIAVEWGSDRSQTTFGPKARSFTRLAGDPNNGVEGAVMCHALRTTGSSVCNMAAVATGEVDIYWDIGCYSWDICAGAIVLQEAGGFISGSKEAFERGAHIGEVLMGRRYIAIRPVKATTSETSEEVQRRIIWELYDVVEEWTNSDM